MLHPLQVSTVLYSVQRMEQLSSLFTALGILTWLHFRIPWLERKATIGEVSNCLLLLTLCLMLAIFSKEDGILMLPLLLLTELVMFRGQIMGEQRWQLQLVCFGGLALGLLGFLFLSLWQPAWLLDTYSAREFTLSERLLTQARVLWQYLAWIIVPDIRGMGLHHDDIVLSSSLFVPYTTFISMIGWLGLSMVESSLLALEMVYEHRNYLPLLGVSLLISWLLWVVLPLQSDRQRVVLVATALLCLVVQLGLRTSLWGDEERMAAYHLRHHPQSARSVYHYANVQLRRGESSDNEAERRDYLLRSRRYYQQILELEDDDFTALVTLLYLDGRHFNSAESERWRQRLLQLSDKSVLSAADGNALDFLTRCLAGSGCQMPREEFESLMFGFLERFPGDPVYYDYLARHAGYAMSDYPAALAYHEAALEQNPEYYPARKGLVEWQRLSGNQGAAVEAVRGLLRHNGSVKSLQHALPMLELPGK
jgi:tetratricopeptide (TPR) repeat protein